jgi:site-specific DNA recombinase
LSRDQVEQLSLKRLLARFGVRVVSAAGETNGNRDALGELLERLIGAVHDFDRKRIIERMRAGKSQGRNVGRHVDGKPPFGYRAGIEPGALEIDEAQAGIVRWMFDVARRGSGPRPIARQLNAEGSSGPTGRLWNRQTVTNILRNPVYCGELHGVKGAQPPVVSRRVWNQAQ